jgi:hypothetical protein
VASVAAGIAGAGRLAGTSLGVGTGPAKVRFAVAVVLAQVAGATPCMETGPASWFATNPGATSTPLTSTLVLGVSLVMAAIWAAEALASQEEETEGTSSTRQALQARGIAKSIQSAFPKHKTTELRKRWPEGRVELLNSRGDSFQQPVFVTVDEHSRFRPDGEDTVYTLWNDLRIKSAAAGTRYCPFQYVSGPHAGGRNVDVARSLQLKP